MHPAPSIIIFTVFSGLGFGALAWVGFGLGPNDPWFAFFALGLGFAFSSIGLLSSLAHLGHPERAWRALSQWRTSWLSREGVLSIAALLCMGIYGLVWLIQGERLIYLGAAGAVLSLLTIYCTAMIYAQLKTVPRWNHPLTPAVYMGFGIASGLVLTLFVSSFFAALQSTQAVVCIALLVIAVGLKVSWIQMAKRTGRNRDGSTPETATGLGFIGKVSMLEGPHTSANYLMKEMVFEIGRKHAHRLRRLAFIATGILPLLLILLALIWPVDHLWLGLALLILVLGLFAERWLFFAEAEHLVGLYYGRR
jgi:DMSO reductase anchor subunit